MSQADAPETAPLDAPTLVIRAGASFDGLLTCPKAARIEGRFTGNVFGVFRFSQPHAFRVGFAREN